MIVGGKFVGRGKHAVSGERNLLVRLVEDPGNQEIRMRCNTPLSLSAVAVNQTSPIILS